jgi:hypothetical protein
VLPLIGPGGVLLRLSGIFADHFLQKDNISLNRANCFAKPVKDKTPVTPGESFMDIDRYYA